MGTKNISSELYRAIPKDVFAAIAVSFACRNCDFSDVENELFKEWMILFENGIVQQKPKKPTKGKPLHLSHM